MRDAGHRTPDAGHRTTDIGHRTAEKAKIIYPSPRGVDIMTCTSWNCPTAKPGKMPEDVFILFMCVSIRRTRDPIEI